LFGLKSDFEMRFTLDDFENMVVYERDIYLLLMESRMTELRQALNNNKQRT
jgi:hypothetical protein